MIEKDGDLWLQIATVANKVIGWCAREILTVDALTEQMWMEWMTMRRDEDQPSNSLLTRIALRNCSRALCAAWRSAQPDIRNCAFENLRRYLHRSIRNSSYAHLFGRDAHAIEDVLHEVLEDLFKAIRRNPVAGPDDPASFLKYAQIAARRHAYTYMQKRQQEAFLSLGDIKEYQLEHRADTHDTPDTPDTLDTLDNPGDKREQNPERYAEHHELQQFLKDAILTLRNKRHQQVLLYTYLGGMEEQELASFLGVSVQEIYMWRYRALQALRNKTEIMQVLQLWRE
jgi:RNA polymerase sigma factor (sigma-70 family)